MREQNSACSYESKRGRHTRPGTEQSMRLRVKKQRNTRPDTKQRMSFREEKPSMMRTKSELIFQKQKSNI